MDIIREGKTKQITAATVGLVESNDMLTAGDGKKRELLPGKGELATSTNCAIMELLRRSYIPVAYIGLGPTPTTFYTQICDMIKFEVVVRRIAKGSYLKRNTNVLEGTRFEEPIVEFFYKTKNQLLGGQPIPVDDPLMVEHPGDGWHIYRPDKPLSEGDISPLRVTDQVKHIPVCNRLALQSFLVLEAALAKLNATLQDIKFEFGIIPDGRVILADVVDCDSWRVSWCGLQLSKQGFRDQEGFDPAPVLQVYQMAEALVRSFR
jgi:phosphoribosylaminoimidazole-succinocarboxamide synthase